MKALLIAFLFWCFASNVQAQSHTQAFISDEAFSKGFRCPEDWPNDQARQDAVRNFVTWAAQSHPGITVSQLIEIRTKFLEAHHCEKTVASIHSSSYMAEKRSARNLCLADDGKRYFSQQTAEQCIPIPMEHGWVNLHSDPNVIVDVMPSEIVREADGAKIWEQFFIAEPVVSEDGTWTYDYVKGVTKYFCNTKEQRLIQATYSLHGRRTYERSSAEAVLEEIEPGTLSEELYNFACKKQSATFPP